MSDIQTGLVHTIKRGACFNCKHPKEAHMDGACLFDFTQYREETMNDHEDCACERVIEEPIPDAVGTVTVNMATKLRKPIQWMGLTFHV